MKKLDLTDLQDAANEVQNASFIFDDLSVQLKDHKLLGVDATSIAKRARGLSAQIDNFIMAARKDNLTDEVKQVAVNSHRNNLVKK